MLDLKSFMLILDVSDMNLTLILVQESDSNFDFDKFSCFYSNDTGSEACS